MRNVYRKCLSSLTKQKQDIGSGHKIAYYMLLHILSLFGLFITTRVKVDT